MRIARLELHGFKSFADRTVFHFGGGISCVVGPNGCGKSNVVDALKWVIGEMSARSLRGEDMLDVIFAGSAERKPVGYAEVSLALSSEGGEPFPGEYARYTEIQLARRLYRDGTSEYLVNQVKARRKDIVDLIMDSGVGNHLYSFIEQGRIDKIVSASPEERRSLIDEAAGITRYKQRRAEARQKLEATASQLDRAADVTDEMGRRLATLEKQVVKAARFRRLRALVRQQEIFLSLVKFRDLRARLDEVRGSAREGAAEVERLTERAAALEEDAALRVGEAEVAAAAVALARDALAEVDAQRREGEARRVLHDRQAQELTRQLESARGEVDAEHARREAALEERFLAQEELEVALSMLDDAEAATMDAAERAEATRAAREAAEVTLRGADQVFSSRSADAREATVRRDTLRATAGELPGRLAVVRERWASGQEEQVVLGKRVAVAEEALAERRALLASLDDERGRREDALGEAQRRELHARDAVGRAELALDAAQRSWTHAVGEVEASSAQGEERVAAEVGREAQVREGAVRELERTQGRRLADADAAERRALSEAAARLRLTVESVQREQDGRVAEARRRLEADLDAEDASWQAKLDAALEAGTTGLAAEEDALRRAHDAAAGEARERKRAAEVEVEAARTAMGDADARLATATRTLREVDAKIAALRAQEEASRSRDAGSVAVSKALAGAPRWMDVARLSDAERDDGVRWLGERLLLPVADTEEALRAAARASAAAGGASVVLVGAREGLLGLLGGYALVDDLAEAVAHHRAHRSGAIVRGTGERIDPDGVVHLGASGRGAEAAVARQGELTTLEARKVESEGEVERLRGALTQARARLESAQIVLRKSGEALDHLERTGRDAMRARLASSRAAADQQAQQVREGRAAWRATARAALDVALASLTAEREAELSAARAAVDAELDGLRAASDARLGEVRTSMDAERASARTEADAAVEAVQRAARARLAEVVAERVAARDMARAEVDRLQRALVTARERVPAVVTATQEARAAVEHVSRQRAEHERVIARVEAEAEGARQQSTALAVRLSSLRDDEVSLVAQLSELSSQQAEVEGRAGEVLAALAVAEEAVVAAREQASAASAAAEIARVAASRADATLASLRERRVSAEARIAGATRQAADAAQRHDATARRVGDLAQALDAARAELAVVEEELGRLSAERQDAAVAWEAARLQDEAVRLERDAVASQRSEVTLRLERSRRALLDAETAERAASGELVTLRDRVEERYQLDLGATLAHLLEHSGLVLEAPEEVREPIVVGSRTVEKVEDRVIRPELLDDEALIREDVTSIEEHRAELSRIGDVNLTALEEYTELKARFDDLETQRSDLQSSVDAIKSAIAKLNKVCRERFRETFDRVDETFRKAYPDLVGGGEARLELTQEEDLLETGVEIFVRPPGKRLQTLSLLSGGEKAMTAIALLLALFTVKPSPFCVLDEVDAPLDEANGARFNDMIRHMSKMTQFIVITHNRKTMECADTLYGITMPVPGCSTLVSVQIDGGTS